MKEKIYKKPEPKKTKIRINWKKAIGALLIATTLAVAIYAFYPWARFFVEKYILKKQSSSIIEITDVGFGRDANQENSQDIYFEVENPNVKIIAPIVEGISEEDLKKGIGHHSGTPWPDEKSGNVIIAGHSSDLDPRNTYGQVFRDLNLVQISDQVSVFYPEAEYIYKVIGKYEIDPKDTSLFGQEAGPRLTFYTCSPVFTDWRRLVFVAILDMIKTEGR